MIAPQEHLRAAPRRLVPAPAAERRPVEEPGPVRLAQCAMSATPESAPALRRFARTVAAHWRLGDECHEALSVIVTELVSNAVLHSGSSWVAVALRVRGNVLTTEVRDGGHWKHRSGRRREPLDAFAAHGRGLRLVNTFAARTLTRRLPAGTVVAAEIALVGAGLARHVAAEGPFHAFSPSGALRDGRPPVLRTAPR
ncbi:ATP-binding protein [Streptomyces sp. NPDC058953]|uniref:ATP-binding protein n=1 Tax=unclassified Streptomyces TaxID=2593676 RepID=UPI0036C59A9E